MDTRKLPGLLIRDDDKTPIIGPRQSRHVYANPNTHKQDTLNTPEHHATHELPHQNKTYRKLSTPNVTNPYHNSTPDPQAPTPPIENISFKTPTFENRDERDSSQDIFSNEHHEEHHLPPHARKPVELHSPLHPETLWDDSTELSDNSSPSSNTDDNEASEYSHSSTSTNTSSTAELWDTFHESLPIALKGHIRLINWNAQKRLRH